MSTDVDHLKQVIDVTNNNYSTVLKENIQKFDTSLTDKLPNSERVDKNIDLEKENVQKVDPCLTAKLETSNIRVEKNIELKKENDKTVSSQGKVNLFILKFCLVKYNYYR